MSNSSSFSGRSPYRPPAGTRRKKPPSQTCGVFLVKQSPIPGQSPSILLVHATHTRWHHWGIPKGLPEPGENWAQAACREVEEETGLQVSEEQLQYIGSIDYPRRLKTLHAFWVRAEEIQLLPLAEMNCSSLVYHDPKFPGPFPEVDAYRWYRLDKAKEVLHEPQLKMLELLEQQLGIN